MPMISSHSPTATRSTAEEDSGSFVASTFTRVTSHPSVASFTASGSPVSLRRMTMVSG